MTKQKIEKVCKEEKINKLIVLASSIKEYEQFKKEVHKLLVKIRVFKISYICVIEGTANNYYHVNLLINKGSEK